MDAKSMKKILSILLLFWFCVSCTNELIEQESSLKIHDIQGCSHTSPFVNKPVSGMVGIVTHKVSNGFTMQSNKPDDKDCSSEGIFVFTNNFPDVIPGNLVSVDGVVEEFTPGNQDDHNLSITEIVAKRIEVLAMTDEIPTPMILGENDMISPDKIIENDGFRIFDPEEDGMDYYESLESMLIEVKNGIVVGSRNEYNEIFLLAEPFISQNIISNEGALLQTANDANPEKIMIKLSTNSKIKVNVGDSLKAPIIGVLDYSYGNYKILCNTEPEFFNKNMEIESNSFKKTDGIVIASYNLENLSLFENEKRFKSIARQIVDDLDSPDIMVIHEIMDDSGTTDDGITSSEKTIGKLIQMIENAGGPQYYFSDSPPENDRDGGIAGGNIRSVLLYRADKNITLEPGDPWTSGIGFDGMQFKIQNNPFRIGEKESNFSGTRKPSIWLLDQNGKQFFVVGVHLTSKDSNSPEWGNLQPPLMESDSKREGQAELINSTISEILSANKDISIFVAGDFNDLPWSRTIQKISGDTLINSAYLEPEYERFSYIFDGNAEQLDYIFINKNLADKIVQSRHIHVNTILDHDSQISDHDPMILEVFLN